MINLFIPSSLRCKIYFVIPKTGIGAPDSGKIVKKIWCDNFKVVEVTFKYVSSFSFSHGYMTHIRCTIPCAYPHCFATSVYKTRYFVYKGREIKYLFEFWSQLTVKWCKKTLKVWCPPSVHAHQWERSTFYYTVKSTPVVCNEYMM